ncbi:MAG: hypothetical protein V7L14_03830 [Nostoc sp.]|uniref:hypothetical protein n=1 Tax=Nostoc sp. TaxID=1180 RepID=UPI002FFAD8F8
MKKALSFAIFAASALACGSVSAAESFQVVQGVPWELATPSSTSSAERLQEALNTCVAKIASDIAIAQTVLEGTGLTVTYRNVAVDKVYGEWSNTQKNSWTGVGKHKAGGVADCSYYKVVNGI